ncbi:MAG: amino acid permease [Gammaproteobacteria bacterium]
MEINVNKQRVLSLFSLVMINVIAIDSLRNVPAAAEYGTSLIFYYVIAAMLFFIPSAMVAAELATGWPKDGGVYIWVREAFGAQWGLLAIWLQWIENVIWYPTIMSFIAATLLFAINPALVEQKIYLLSVMLILFWGATILNMMGMRVSALLSTLSAIFGTLLPMLLIIFLGALWILQGHPSNISLTPHALFPDLTHITNLTFLTGVLLSLVGVELSAAYAQSVRNPQRDYPRAMLISVSIIIVSLIFSSLAIAIVLPKEKINLVDGLVEAFGAFFDAYHMSWMTGVIAAVIIIGGIGNVAAWILGPSKGLLAASRDGRLPRVFAHENRHGAPAPLLILQAIIFTVLCSVFLLMPSVSSSYWVLTALTTQLYMVMYFLMFAAGIRLRYLKPNVVRSYRLPGGNLGMWIVAGIGACACLIAIAIGFLPPTGFNYGSIQRYELILITGFVLLSIPPFIYTGVRRLLASSASGNMHFI